MKKVLVLFGMFALAQISAMAYMYEKEAASLKTIEMQGYSTTTMELVDYIKYRNGNISGNYVRHFDTKSKSKLGRGYHALKTYFDPVQDDGLFGHHEIEYSNTWQGDKPFYASDLVKNGQTEDL